MRELIVINNRLQHSSFLGRLQTRYKVHKWWEHQENPGTTGLQFEAIQGIVTESKAERELIEMFPNARVIANFGVGFDGVDVEYATARGIRVTNTPDVLTEDVADMAILLLLATSRGLCVGDRWVRQGKFSHGFRTLTNHVHGKRVGILGLGRIGQAIARRAVAFCLKVSYHGPREKPGLPYPYVPDLALLAENSDYLVVSCPGGKDTRRLVNREVLEALGPQGVLVNTARGTVVDEPVMIEMLQQEKLGGAGLDVFENEPHVPEALFSMDNVVLQPHRGSATVKTRVAMGEVVLKNLDAFFSGNPAPNPVNEIGEERN